MELWRRTGGDEVEDSDDESNDNLSRRRNHVAHLIDCAKLAVRGAIYAGEELDGRRKGP